MKCIELKKVFEYKDSEKWLSEEVSGKLLMASVTFVSFQKQFIKVHFINIIIRRSYFLLKCKYNNTISLIQYI